MYINLSKVFPEEKKTDGHKIIVPARTQWAACPAYAGANAGCRASLWIFITLQVKLPPEIISFYFLQKNSENGTKMVR